VTIQEFEKEKVVRVENAPEAIWKNGIWTMPKGTIYELTTNGKSRTMNFKNQVIPYVMAPEDIPRAKKNLDELTIRELLETGKVYEAAHTDTTSVYIELHRRFAFPLASFVFSLVGAPLGVQRERSSSSFGFGLSVVLIFIYYAIMTFLEAMGKGHIIPVVLAAWAPNLISIIFAAFLIRRANR